MKLQIRFITNPNIIRKSLLALYGCLCNKRKGHVTALADQGYSAFGHIP